MLCNQQGTNIKNYSLLLLAVLSIVLAGSMAPASAAPAPAPAQAITAEADPMDIYADCLQDCLDQYLDNLDQCKKACWRCGTHILFCWSGSYDKTCLRECSAIVQDVHEACEDTCKKP